MDQLKIGAYLKELRKDKSITQEQLADILNVSRRTVSRWETGSNLPDLDLLIELADFYSVDLRQLLEGEAKPVDELMETKETLAAVAEISNDEKVRITRNFNIIFICCTLCMVGYLIVLFATPDGYSSSLLDFLNGIFLGVSFGGLLLGVLFTSKKMGKLSASKRKVLNSLKGSGSDGK
jgi:transcriptional regulator with XRE-family HTH domain